MIYNPILLVLVLVLALLLILLGLPLAFALINSQVATKKDKNCGRK